MSHKRRFFALQVHVHVTVVVYRQPRGQNSTCAHERRRLHLVWPALLPAVTLLALVPVVSASVALADGRVAIVGNSENHANLPGREVDLSASDPDSSRH